MTWSRGGLHEKIREILRESSGPVGVDYVVWRFRDDKVPPCRVKNAIGVMIERGHLVSSRGDNSSVAGTFDVWLPTSTVANPSARRQPNALQRLLCSPLVAPGRTAS